MHTNILSDHLHFANKHDTVLLEGIRCTWSAEQIFYPAMDGFLVLNPSVDRVGAYHDHQIAKVLFGLNPPGFGPCTETNEGIGKWGVERPPQFVSSRG